MVWTADLKGWFRLGNGQRCDPVTVTDSFSRYLLACQATSCPTTAEVRVLFEQLFRTAGLPAVIRTDNGAPFASTAVGGLSTLSVWWLKLSIRPERIQPGQPTQNARHERFHGTLAQDLCPQVDLPAQQQAFDRFLMEYNTLRPHESLGQTPPAAWYQPSPRPYPGAIPPVLYPATMHVRYVHPNGAIKWRGQLLYVSQCLAREHVGLLPLDDRLLALYFADLPLAILDDATRRWLPRKPTRARLLQLRTPLGAGLLEE